jgi:hypothetical protein
MTNWYSGIYKSLIIASVISFIIYYFSSGNVSLGALISGYSVLTLSILMILYIILFNLLQATQNQGFFQSILTMITACGPFLLMLFVIGFTLYSIIKYKNRILLGRVSNGYATFSNITILMTLLQVYLVYTNINTDKFETTKKLSKITTSILYLYGVITAISSITLFTILNNFSADGFQSTFYTFSHLKRPLNTII